ncbi:MAG: 6-phosphogluconolactonase [Pseudomonadota bacterium]
MAFGFLASTPLTEHVPDPSGAITLHVHRDMHVWTWAAAVAIAAELRRDLQARPRSRLLVSGDAPALPVYQALSRAPLDWTRVDVGLTDERWLRPDDPDSRAAAVRRSLLVEHAAAARFETLTLVGRRIEDAVATANAHAHQPTQVAVLVLGEDGSVAGLSPRSPDCGRALTSQQAYVALDAPLGAGEAPWARRISITPAGLARPRMRILLLRGTRQREMLEESAAGGGQGVLRALQQAGGPLQAHWCP